MRLPRFACNDKSSIDVVLLSLRGAIATWQSIFEKQAISRLSVLSYGKARFWTMANNMKEKDLEVIEL
jgi:hypothetical protein